MARRREKCEEKVNLFLIDVFFGCLKWSAGMKRDFVGECRKEKAKLPVAQVDGFCTAKTRPVW
jgi:hypothetical protein